MATPSHSLVLMILAACLALFGCSDSDRQRLTLTGSSTVAPHPQHGQPGHEFRP